jgi:ABC-2 type transport system ATP-binding protein
MLIKVMNLKRYFGTTRAVEDLSFSFEGGQIWGFVGPNGAGKTTTMRVMATLEEPTSGDVMLNGVSVVQDPEKARGMVGFVPDTLPTYADMGVQEYLDFFGRAYGLQGQKRRAVIGEIEEFTKLTGMRDKVLRSLSKGMKQRVNLARALVHDPPVLLMDEPEAGLDPRACIELRELVRALAAHGKAILVSSHILSSLSEMIDGVIIIEQGRLLRIGRMHEIQSRTDGCLVVIRPVEAVHEAMQKDLLEMPHVEKVTISGGMVRVVLSGTEEEAGLILSVLVTKGHRIAEFRQEHGSLEDIFMSITKGEVS